MAKQTIDQLKQWFEDGDYPTQSQFWDWLDSYIHKDDKIGIEQVFGLAFILQGKMDAGGGSGGGGSNSDVVLPAGTAFWDAPEGILIEKVWIMDVAEINFGIGITPGGSEIFSGQTLEYAPKIVTIDYPFIENTTIYFSGITENTIIKLYLR